MSDMPLISIIMPVYKVEKYIRKSLDCVINQTYKNIEIILVDDGSPDNCPAICDEYAEKDSRIKVIHKKNGGVGSARNAGLAVATGDYLLQFDSDDYVSLNACEIILGAALRYKADIVIFDYEKVDEDGNLIKKIPRSNVIPLPMNETIWNRQELFERIVSIDSEVGGFSCNKMIKMNILKGLSFTEERMVSEDLLFIQAVPERVNIAVFIPHKLYTYVWHQGSLTNNLDDFDVCEVYIKDVIMQTALRCFPESIDICIYSMADICFRIIKKSRSNYDVVRKIQQLMRKNVKFATKCELLPLKQKFYFVLCSFFPYAYLFLKK